MGEGRPGLRDSCSVCMDITISITPRSQHMTLSPRPSFLTLDVQVENGTKEENPSYKTSWSAPRQKAEEATVLTFLYTLSTLTPPHVLHLPSFDRTLSLSLPPALLFPPSFPDTSSSPSSVHSYLTF